MRVMRRVLLIAGMGATGVIVMPGCSADAPLPSGPEESALVMFSMTGSGGLSANKSAMGYWNRKTVYDWSVSKTLLSPTPVGTPAAIPLGPGVSVDMVYRLSFTKAFAGEAFTAGVKGSICVRNEGGSATQNLRIVDVVHMSMNGGETYVPHTAPVDLDVSAYPTLGPGEEHCYPYNISMSPTEGATYRNVATITADNFDAVEGGYPFVMPATPDNQFVDAYADITDVVTCPDGLTCTPIEPTMGMGGSGWQWLMQGSSFSVDVVVRVTNQSLPCATVELVNALRLQENDGGSVNTNYGGQLRIDEVRTRLDAGACTVSGCTPGFWQGGAGRTLWNVSGDADWDGALAQPFWHAVPFNGYFASHAALMGKSMYQLVSTGAGPVPAIKAARSLVAAYLNASYHTAYPWTRAELTMKWASAVLGGDEMLRALHTELDAANNLFDCRQSP